MLLLHIHIALGAAWLGVLGCETVMELMAKDLESRRRVAQYHKWIDILLEGPLAVSVLVTGLFLLARLWPEASTLLLVKIGCGLIGVTANLICLPFVQARAKAESEAEIAHWTKRIAQTGFAIPFIVAAMGIGLFGGN